MDTALPRSVKADFNNSFLCTMAIPVISTSAMENTLLKQKTQPAKTEFTVSFYIRLETIATIPRGIPRRTHTNPALLLGHPAKRTGRAEMVSHLQQGKHPSRRRIILDRCKPELEQHVRRLPHHQLFKNFDIVSNTFHSTWNESKVSCESCHGPASLHLQWAEKKTATDSLRALPSTWKAKPFTGRLIKKKALLIPTKLFRTTHSLKPVHAATQGHRISAIITTMASHFANTYSGNHQHGELSYRRADKG